jgi:S-adenosylmethionine uptake transporter
MTRAYSQGATLVVASMQYAGIVFASIFSLTLFGDRVTSMGWMGIAIIVASGILATVLRARAMPNTRASELQ